MHRHIDLLGVETRPCVLQLSHRVEVKSSRLRSSTIKNRCGAAVYQLESFLFGIHPRPGRRGSDSVLDDGPVRLLSGAAGHGRT